MELRAGIVGAHVEGWKLLLQQEGFSFSVLPSEVLPTPDSCSVLIVGDSTSYPTSAVRSYLSAGGAVVCSGVYFRDQLGGDARTRSIKYLVGNPTAPFASVRIMDVQTTGVVPSNANGLLDERGARSMFVGEYGGGMIAVLPFDAGTLILDRRTAQKSFYGSSARLPFEDVSCVSKGEVRRLVAATLEHLHHRRGLPYAHRWYYPDGQETLFAWRIDADSADLSEIERLYTAVHSLRIPATWFIDVKSQQGFLSYFGGMEQQEIGLHCYEHETYDDYDRNATNVRRGLELLHQHNLHPRGFAAPFGRWNPAIERVVQDVAFEYSSEFQYDYDNLPSFPIAAASNSTVLQVPIHPISIGTLRRLGFHTDELREYFHSVAALKRQLREPLFFYHHPRNGHEEVLREIFESVKAASIRTSTMVEYARWWTRSASIVPGMRLNGSVIELDAFPSDVWIRISRPDRTEAIVPMKSHVNIDALVWRPMPEPPALPADIRRVRRFNSWIPIIRTQDFLHKKLIRP
jgi:hypothetical protein